jgi:hypothetical protein
MRFRWQVYAKLAQVVVAMNDMLNVSQKSFFSLIWIQEATLTPQEDVKG